MTPAPDRVANKIETTPDQDDFISGLESVLNFVPNTVVAGWNFAKPLTSKVMPWAMAGWQHTLDILRQIRGFLHSVAPGYISEYHTSPLYAGFFQSFNGRDG